MRVVLVNLLSDDIADGSCTFLDELRMYSPHTYVSVLKQGNRKQSTVGDHDNPMARLQPTVQTVNLGT